MRRSLFIAAPVALCLVAASGCRHKHARPAPVASAPRAPGTTAPRNKRGTQPDEAIRKSNGETGIASWYGIPYHGRPAANGEIYDMEKLTAAHRTLPFGTWVRVTNLSNQKTVDVRITDRGPFVDGRIIDLSKAAARAIEMIGPGVATVRMDIVSAPAELAPALYAVQVGAFQDQNRAERVRASLAARYQPVRIVERAATPRFWRVLVGESRTLEEAGAMASRLRPTTGEAFVVSLEGVALTPTGGEDAGAEPSNP